MCDRFHPYLEEQRIYCNSQMEATLFSHGKRSKHTSPIASYILSSGSEVQVYIQCDYDVPSKSTINNKLLNQYGMQDGMTFKFTLRWGPCQNFFGCLFLQHQRGGYYIPLYSNPLNEIFLLERAPFQKGGGGFWFSDFFYSVPPQKNSMCLWNRHFHASLTSIGGLYI